MYSLSHGYSKDEKYFKDNQNIERNNVIGDLKYPDKNTIFAIGANPEGSTINNGSATGAYSNIEVYSVRIYNKYLAQDEIDHNYKIDKNRYNIDEKPSTLGYATDGLVILYDGENNTEYGHSDTTSTWRNIAGGSNNGTLMNFNHIETSGWSSNSLKLDGIDDWVKMPYLHYSNMTVEIVLKNTDIVNGKSQKYINNFEAGGIGFGKTLAGNLCGECYIGSAYSTMVGNIAQAEKVYSLSTGYNGSMQYFRENNIFNKQTKTGTYKAPDQSTIFAIGGNPKGAVISNASNATYANIEVYSVRIYNRCLSENEIMKNYEVDKTRFNVE